jgi:hypothetical protein
LVGHFLHGILVFAKSLDTGDDCADRIVEKLYDALLVKQDKFSWSFLEEIGEHMLEGSKIPVDFCVDI